MSLPEVSIMVWNGSIAAQLEHEDAVRASSINGKNPPEQVQRKKKKRSRKKKRTHFMKNTCVDFVMQWQRFADDAAAGGLNVRKKQVQCSNGKVFTVHVMIDAGGKRMLDYWPGNGTVRSPVTGKKSKVSSWEDVIALSQEIAAEEYTRNNPDAQTAQELGW
jgi:hypothetical protein